jgi:hypothetical protein
MRGLVGLIFSLAIPVAAQVTPQRIAAEPQCASCRIELTRVTVIADADTGLIGPDPIIARAGDGRIAMAGRGMQGIAIFDDAGRYLRTVGRRGQGPMEFATITAMRFASDGALHVHDAGNRRESLLNPRLDSAYSRPAVTALWGNTFLLLPNGELLITGLIAGREARGNLFHRLTSDRTVAASFGPQATVPPPRDPRHDFRSISTMAADHFWASHFSSQRLEQWSVTGQLLRVLEGAPAWLEGSLRPHTRVTSLKTVMEPPPPFIVSSRLANERTMWLLGIVPERRWRAPKLTQVGSEFAVQDSGPMHELFDTIIEVIDPIAGTLLARSRVDQYFNQFADGEHLARRLELPSGEVVVEIWRLRVAR